MIQCELGNCNESNKFVDDNTGVVPEAVVTSRPSSRISRYYLLRTRPNGWVSAYVSSCVHACVSLFADSPCGLVGVRAVQRLNWFAPDTSLAIGWRVYVVSMLLVLVHFFFLSFRYAHRLISLSREDTRCLLSCPIDFVHSRMITGTQVNYSNHYRGMLIIQ